MGEKYMNNNENEKIMINLNCISTLTTYIM